MSLPARLPRDRRALRPAQVYGLPPLQPAAPAAGRDLLETVRKLWRHRVVIALSTVAGAVLVGALLVSVPSRYVAESRVLVGIAEPRVVSVESIVADISPDAERVQNEALVIQSREIARHAIERLALAKNPEFNPTLRPRTLWQEFVSPVIVGVKDAFRAALGADEPARRRGDDPAGLAERLNNIMVDILLSRVDVTVIGRSHVLSIKAQAENPEIASGIANTLAELYLGRQRQDKVKATGEAEQFLEARIAELRKQVQASDQAVEQYRRRNDLYKGGANTGVTEQQLTELNTQIVLAQTARAEAQSRLREAQQVGRTGKLGDSVPDVLRSPLIQGLKQQQVEAERRLSEVSGTLGDRHPKMASARADLANVQRKIKAEIQHVISGLRHEANTAASRHEALRRNFERLKGDMAEVNKKSIQLEALERDAAANRTLLEEMLRRSKETVGQDQMLKASARFISAAAPPEAPTVPPKGLIFCLGTFGAFLVGSLWSILRENADRTFRRSDQLQHATGLPVLAAVPHVRSARSASSYILRKPFSAYAESLRKLYIGLDLSNVQHSPKTVLFASAVPAEGKSMLVASLGRMLANNGRRVLLIDCDWRCPSQGRLFGCQARAGLAAFLTGDTVRLEDAIFHDDISGLDVVPSGALTPSNMHLLSSDRMRAVIDTLAKGYDTVLLDTPPVLVGAEVLALVRMVEKVVFTVRWGHTQQDAVLDALKQVLDAGGDVAGLVLSRVDARRYRQYAHSDLNYRYGRPALAEL
ncbi:MAG: polysaccharide biosynthesis tyrosine autokinase [Alphaproteobacteria bacterium]|nr:polysaccharide biosynthesis tyrosine autokinase [Alphaproteobacteria bacterium]